MTTIERAKEALTVTHSHLEEMTVVPVRNRKNIFRVTGWTRNEYTGERIEQADFRATVHANGDVQLWIPGWGTFGMVPAPTA